MKKNWYKSTITKGILIVLEHIFVVVLALSLVGMLFLADHGIYLTDLTKKDYTKTSTFRSNLEIDSGDLLRRLQAVLEYNQYMDHPENKIVDMEYTVENESYKLSFENKSGFAYHLDDLLTWSAMDLDNFYVDTPHDQKPMVSNYDSVVYEVESGSKYGNKASNAEIGSGRGVVATDKDMAQAYETEAANENLRSEVSDKQAEFSALDGRLIVCLKPDNTYDYFTQKDFIDQLNKGLIEIASYETESTSSALEKKHALQTLIYHLQTNTDYINMNGEDISSILSKNGQIKYTDFWTYSDPIIDEKFAPIGYRNLLDLVQNNQNWNGLLNTATNDLHNILWYFRNIQESPKNLEDFNADKTNLRYCLIDASGTQFLTNIEGLTPDNYEKKLGELSDTSFSYMISPNSMDFDTDFTENMVYIEQYVRNSSFLKDCTLYVRVPNDFPVGDYLGKSARNYNTYHPYLGLVSIAFLLSLLLFLADTIWLTIIAGRKSDGQGPDEYRGVFLNSFDKWYTELSAAIVILPWLIGLYILYAAFDGIVGYDPYVYIEICIFVVLLALFTTPMFLWGYLSLVRRIKAGILWKNSLLRAFLRGSMSFLKFCLEHLNIAWKVALFTAAFLFFQMVGFAYTFNTYHSEFILVMMLADLVILVFLIRYAAGWDKIRQGLGKIVSGDTQYQISIKHLTPDQQQIAENINHIGDGLDAAIEQSLKNERTKTELITNVSHDIKTPLTSIINYVDLMNRENIEDEKLKGYLKIIDTKAHQLKVLTEDIVEASKASAGNLTMDMTDLNFIEMISQVMGEFQEKYEVKNLTMVPSFPEDAVTIHADGARMWRVLENIFGNVEKYALPGTRVYIDLTKKDNKIVFSLKNISAQALNISADELTERFIRGDISRNTEGSGLGLSIAKSLVELQGGSFRLYLDGDLFKVEIVFQK